jgi:hypothetical protein
MKVVHVQALQVGKHCDKYGKREKVGWGVDFSWDVLKGSALLFIFLNNEGVQGQGGIGWLLIIFLMVSVGVQSDSLKKQRQHSSWSNQQGHQAGFDPSRAGCAVSVFVPVDTLCLHISLKGGVIIAILVFQSSQGHSHCGDSAGEGAAFFVWGTGLELPCVLNISRLAITCCGTKCWIGTTGSGGGSSWTAALPSYTSDSNQDEQDHSNTAWEVTFYECQ